MQGKALALLALLLACLAAGCGGGGGDTSGPSGQSGSTQAAPQAVQKLRSSAKRVEAERSKQAKAPPVKRGQDEGEGNPSAPSPEPKNTHHDSGGGSARFRNKGGDNSIQESGHEASASEREAAAAVLHAYLDARAAHRWSDACFYIAASLAATMEEFAARYGKQQGVESCPQVLAALATGSSQQALEETAEADVGSLRIEGDHAFLLYYGPGNAPYAMPMVREGGAWKVGSLEGTPLS